MCSRLFLLLLAAILIFSVSAQMKKSGPATNNNSQRMQEILTQKRELARKVEMSISDQRKADAAIAQVNTKLSQQPRIRSEIAEYNSKLATAKQNLIEVTADLQALLQGVPGPIVQVARQDCELKIRLYKDCQRTIEAQLRLLQESLRQGGDLEREKRKLTTHLQCLQCNQRQMETQLQNLGQELANLNRQK